MLCDSAGKGLLEAYTWLLPDLPHMPFPFAHFALHLFTIVNDNHEHSYTLNLVSLPSKSWKPGMVLEQPNP